MPSVALWTALIASGGLLAACSNDLWSLHRFEPSRSCDGSSRNAKQFSARQHNLRLRGAGAAANDMWDVKTGHAQWDDIIPEALMPLDEEDSFSDGTDAEFTLFRHVQSGAAVEIVNDVDDEDCRGFFRFLSADIFDITPDSPHFANFSHACPGWVCFVNGHCTGDWLQAKNLYAELKSAPGRNLYTSDLMKKSNWTTVEQHAEGNRSSVHVLGPGEAEVLEHKSGNWTVWDRDGCIFLQHKCCRDAQIVLTADGFVYIGCADSLGVVTSEPKCIEVLDVLPHRQITADAAVRRRNTYMSLAQ